MRLKAKRRTNATTGARFDFSASAWSLHSAVCPVTPACVGSALGIAILGTALTTGLASGTRQRLEAVPSIPPPQRAAITAVVERSGGAVLPAFRRSPQLQPAVAPVEDAFVASARRAAFIAAAFVLVGLAAAFRLRPGRQDEPEPGPT